MKAQVDEFDESLQAAWLDEVCVESGALSAPAFLQRRIAGMRYKQRFTIEGADCLCRFPAVTQGHRKIQNHRAGLSCPRDCHRIKPVCAKSTRKPQSAKARPIAWVEAMSSSATRTVRSVFGGSDNGTRHVLSAGAVRYLSISSLVRGVESRRDAFAQRACRNGARAMCRQRTISSDSSHYPKPRKGTRRGSLVCAKATCNLYTPP